MTTKLNEQSKTVCIFGGMDFFAPKKRLLCEQKDCFANNEESLMYLGNLSRLVDKLKS